MSMSNYARLAWKYRQHWNRKLLSLSGSVLLKVSEIQALVPLILVLSLRVWLALRVLASWLSMLANCSLVLLLQWDFDHERVEEVGLLVVLLVIGLVVGASSQLELLSTGMILVKIGDGGLYFCFSFLFLFSFSFNFLFLEQLGLGFISHAVTSVTNWWHSHKTDHETWEKEVEGTRTKWCHTTWTTHVGLM